MPPIYEIGSDAIRRLEPTSYEQAGLAERADLQRMLRDQIEVVAPDVLVIAEEFGEWTESRRRIDLLGIDKEANLVVFELKRTEDGGHMELQAVRYAAMVANLTAGRATEMFGHYLAARGREEDPEQVLLDHLGWNEMDEDQFAQDVRIVLVSADFSRELTTAVMWLNDKELDIRCVRIKPYDDDGRTFIDVQQIIPLPEAGSYQIQVREKRRQERKARESNMDFTRYDVTLDGETHPAQWKRNALLLVVKALHAHGVPLEEIGSFFRARGRGNALFSVEGEINTIEKFNELAARDALALGKRYNARRWHTKDGDQMTSGGRTWVFSNQWGARWHEFMSALAETYPQIGLEFSASDPDDDS